MGTEKSPKVRLERTKAEEKEIRAEGPLLVEKKTTSITLIVTQGDGDKVALRQSRGAEGRPPCASFCVVWSRAEQKHEERKAERERGREEKGKKRPT